MDEYSIVRLSTCDYSRVWPSMIEYDTVKLIIFEYSQISGQNMTKYIRIWQIITQSISASIRKETASYAIAAGILARHRSDIASLRRARLSRYIAIS